MGAARKGGGLWRAVKPHPRLCFGSLCFLELSEPYHQERYKEEASGVCVGPASRCSEGARVSGQRLLQRAAVWGSSNAPVVSRAPLGRDSRVLVDLSPCSARLGSLVSGRQALLGIHRGLA